MVYDLLEESLGVYFHIPFCTTKCNYCSFHSLTGCSETEQNSIIKKILQDATFFLETNPKYRINTIYIGGGTPSGLSSSLLEYFLSQISKLMIGRQSTSNGNQFYTVEINPETFTEKKMEILQKNGVTRLSIGIQSFSQKVLKGIHRGSSEKDFERLEELLKSWDGEISFDFIAGLPDQTENILISDIEKVIGWGANHISLYDLTLEEETPLTKNLKKIPGPWQDSNYRGALSDNASQFLTSNGFGRYEISNFSKPNYESLHNQCYWNLGQYVGFGPSAVSNLITNDRKMVRYFAPNDHTEFLSSSWEKQDLELLNSQDILKDLALVGLRTKWGMSKTKWENYSGIPWSEFKKQMSQGWDFIETNDRISLNMKHWDHLDRFLRQYFEKIEKI